MSDVDHIDEINETNIEETFYSFIDKKNIYLNWF